MEVQRYPTVARESVAESPFRRNRLRRLSTASFLWAVFWVNVAVIVWFWLNGGGINAVHGWADAFTSIGRFTGLISAYLLLVQVLLLARIPWLEQTIGFDRLTVWHRRNGKLCLYLVLAHVLFITIGYAGLDHLSITGEIQSLLKNYPGMIEATIGTAMIIAIVVTSLVIVRRRLRYETWYLVHLLAYAGIVLAWFHQIPTGNEFAVNARQAAYWTALYLVSLAILLALRFASPAFRAWYYRMRVVEVVEESGDVVSVRIAGRHLDRLGARAGQFFLWRFLDAGRWWESHPFSLSAAPDGQVLRITVKQSGDFTRRMKTIRPGTTVVAEGPFGVFTDAARRSDRVVLIAGGIGITPLRALVEEMDADMVLIYRVVRDGDLIFRTELERLARERCLTLRFVVGHHATEEGRNLLSPDHLKVLVPDIEDRDVYVCGPPIMADIIQRHVIQAGARKSHIHMERFAL